MQLRAAGGVARVLVEQEGEAQAEFVDVGTFGIAEPHGQAAFVALQLRGWRAAVLGSRLTARAFAVAAAGEQGKGKVVRAIQFVEVGCLCRCPARTEAARASTATTLLEEQIRRHASCFCVQPLFWRIASSNQDPANGMRRPVELLANAFVDPSTPLRAKPPMRSSTRRYTG